MKSSCLWPATAVLLFARAGAAESSGGAFTLVTPGVSGGGGTSAGGTYTLTGTAGQPATRMLQGGGFTLQGGFYGVLVAPTVGGTATLVVALDGAGNAVLTWDQDGFTLEFRDALNAGADWQPVTPAPAGRTFSTPANQAARFYRLRRP